MIYLHFASQRRQPTQILIIAFHVQNSCKLQVLRKSKYVLEFAIVLKVRCVPSMKLGTGDVCKQLLLAFFEEYVENFRVALNVFSKLVLSSSVSGTCAYQIEHLCTHTSDWSDYLNEFVWSIPGV